MATQFVSGNRVFAQPGIDGGEFTVPGGAIAPAILIIARFRDVETGYVLAVQSAGVLNLGTSSQTPQYQRFNTLTSSGLSIPLGQASAGVTYDWGCLGVGG